MLYSLTVELKVHIDGGSRGNPGKAAIGVVFQGFPQPNDKLTISHNSCIGTATNNEAEYTALLYALRIATQYGASSLVVYSDSQLIVRQMQGKYRVYDSKLIPLYKMARELVAKFSCFTIHHIPREDNTEADKLVNEALDGQERGEGRDTALRGVLAEGVSS